MVTVGAPMTSTSPLPVSFRADPPTMTFFARFDTDYVTPAGKVRRASTARRHGIASFVEDRRGLEDGPISTDDFAASASLRVNVIAASRSYQGCQGSAVGLVHPEFEKAWHRFRAELSCPRAPPRDARSGESGQDPRGFHG